MMEDLKNEGNKLMKAGDIAEAIELYTKAISLEATAILYSNRSSAYLKLQKYYEAHCDAQQAIEIDPLWSKGYFRVGEVRSSIGQYAEALTAYQTAQLCQEHSLGFPDPLLVQRIEATQCNQQLQRRYTRNMPWVCAGVGLIVAVLIIVADYGLAKTPALTHVLVQCLFVLVLSGLGGGVGKVWMWYAKHLRTTRLQPTLLQQQEQEKECTDTDHGETDDANGSVPGSADSSPGEGAGTGRQHPRYTKAQARQRYKKGKT